MKRPIVIDTDTGSDDAVALVLALRDPAVEVLAITTVAGNVGVEQATQNALMTVDYAERDIPPVYQGCAKPLYHPHISAEGVHGEDGMGDLDTLVPSARRPEKGHAVDALCTLGRKGGVELLALGPLTNVALAMMKDPEAMRGYTRITLMGGAYTKGNTGHLAEFNLWEDAEAADYVFTFGVPITMVTIEACRDGAKITQDDCARIKATGSRCGAFCVDCNRTLYEASARYGEPYFTLPDAAAAAVLLRPDLVAESFDSYTRVECQSELAYGATVNDRRPRGQVEFASKKSTFPPFNCQVVHRLEERAFKEWMIATIV